VFYVVFCVVFVSVAASFGNDTFGDSETHGPVVSFVDLAYRVPDNTAPLGRKEVLNKMSG
jgi:hypothetical protein